MQRLGVAETVYELSQHFLSLHQDVEDLITRGEGLFSLDYLEDMKKRYNKAYLACQKYLQSECCKQCLIIKLTALDLDQYAMDLCDDTDSDSGLEM